MFIQSSTLGVVTNTTFILYLIANACFHVKQHLLMIRIKLKWKALAGCKIKLKGL